MTVSDAALMEASLVALGDGYDGMAAELFEAIVADLPHHAPAFLNPEAARERMTRETLEALLGLAQGEPWVAVTVVGFVDLHRNYADFTAADYARWLALTIAAMERRAGARWPAGARAAWERQAARLSDVIAAEIRRDWSRGKLSA